MIRALIGIRNGLSRVHGVFIRGTDREPVLPGGLHELACWCRARMEWRRDRLWGYLDIVRTVGQMNKQLCERGIIRGDCEDLATYVGYLLHRMGYGEIWRVNIYSHRHVVCIFRSGDSYMLFSNGILLKGRHSGVSEAVWHWCKRRGSGGSGRYYAERLYGDGGYSGAVGLGV